MSTPRKYPVGYYYYLLCYPEGTPFYVGSGKGNRFWASLRLPNISPTVDKIVSRGRVPLVIVIETESKLEARFGEKASIKKFGRCDNGTGILLNRTDGQGSSGRILTEEARAGMRIKRAPASPELREARSVRMRGNQYALGTKHTEETKRKLSAMFRGRRMSLTDSERARRSKQVTERNKARGRTKEV